MGTLDIGTHAVFQGSYVAIQVNFTHLMLKQPQQQDTHKAIQVLHH